MRECPNSGSPCFCTGACRGDSITDPYEPYVPPDDSDGWSNWDDSSTLYLDPTPTYFWAVPEDEVESNSEALQYIMNSGANLDQFYEGYAILRGGFIPNLIDWGEAGFTIVAVDDSRTGIQQQIRDLS